MASRDTSFSPGTALVAAAAGAGAVAAWAYFTKDQRHDAGTAKAVYDRVTAENRATSAGMVARQTKPVKRCEMIDDKEEFMAFLFAATRSQETPEYQELYRFLLACFTEADTDFDGMVGPAEFDFMVERAGGLPRKFGFAPSAAEQFASADARRKARSEMFKTMDTSGDQKIAFDEWFEFAYTHICQKTCTINPEEARWKLGIMSQEDFVDFLRKACGSTNSMEYKELYRWLLACFTSADAAGTGMISVDQFDGLIDKAAEEPRRLGYAPSYSQTYASEEDRKAARAQQFKDMDTTSCGSIAFDKFLAFTYSHICEKVKSLENDATPAYRADFAARKRQLPADKEAFANFVIKASDPSTTEYQLFYNDMLDCFTWADTDFDGLVGADEFDLMVERAGAYPRRFGFAPSTAELYPTTELRLAARTAMFKKMDTSGDNQIAFDEWLQFTFTHICAKAKELNMTDAKKRLGTFNADDFVTFVKAACASTNSSQFKELYHWLLRCFNEADTTRRGRINPQEFNRLIDKSAEEPRRLGFAPPASATFRSDAEQASARTKMFEDMDTDRSGFIGFDEFLAFTYKHICEKAKRL